MNASVTPTWWHRQRWYLLGALVFGAWAFYAPYRDAWRNYAHSHPLVPIDVPKGQSAGYSGARWRLLNLTERDAPKLGEARMLLVARFEMVLDPDTDIDSLALCKVRLVDARGREWDDSSMIGSSVPRDERLPDDCRVGLDANFREIKPRPGKPWLFEKGFIVPRGLDLGRLRPQVFVITPAMPAAPGTYLRFTP